MNDSIDATNVPLQERKRLVQVTWYSGNETFDLALLEEAFNSNSSRTIVTREIRYKEDLTVRYEPMLKVLGDDSFSLTYQHTGTWITGDATGQPANGDIGEATYKITFEDGVIRKLTCVWIPRGGSKVTAKPNCKIVDMDEARLHEAYFRSVRDQNFRDVIFGDAPACAITGEREIKVLDAAHIHQVKDGGADSIENGIVLRKDLHALFDAHIVCIDEHGVFTMQPILASYQELFSEPRAITAEKTQTLLANITARNTARTGR